MTHNDTENRRRHIDGVKYCDSGLIVWKPFWLSGGLEMSWSIKEFFRVGGIVSAVALAASSSQAMAADISFLFGDGATENFYGRQHVAGTVTGKLLGLTDNTTSLPTAIQIFSSPDLIGLVEGTYTGNFTAGSGFTMSSGSVIAANFFFNFKDANNNSFQMRFNCTDLGACPGNTANMNLLFWNGGSTPYVGTGNQAGFAGVTYGNINGAVPEPATWALMLIGFGAVGTGMRHRRRQSVSVSYA